MEDDIIDIDPKAVVIKCETSVGNVITFCRIDGLAICDDMRQLNTIISDIKTYMGIR